MRVGSKKQGGFGVIELIIIAGIVVVLGGLGFIAYNSFIKPKIENDSVSAQDKRDAQATVQAFYAKYTNGGGADLVSQYGTDNLMKVVKTGNKNYSPIVCAQNVAPPSTTSATFKDGHFIVPVTLNFSTPLKFNVEVVKSGDVFKIDKVDCPKYDLG